jgi:hypothetical protein
VFNGMDVFVHRHSSPAATRPVPGFGTLHGTDGTRSKPRFTCLRISTACAAICARRRAFGRDYGKRRTPTADHAALAAALSTGTKVMIDNYGRKRDGIWVATLDEVAFGVFEDVTELRILSWSRIQRATSTFRTTLWDGSECAHRRQLSAI